MSVQHIYRCNGCNNTHTTDGNQMPPTNWWAGYERPVTSRVHIEPVDAAPIGHACSVACVPAAQEYWPKVQAWVKLL